MENMKSYQKVIHFDKPENETLSWQSHTEEKLDGSMARIYLDGDGGVVFGSHHKCGLENLSSQFAELGDNEEFFKKITCTPTTIFAEYIPKKKANVLVYDRIPSRGLVVFDVYVHTGKGAGFLPPQEKMDFCSLLDLECVQYLSPALPKEEVLKSKSMLGGPIEGIVKKDYGIKYNVGERHSLYGHVLMGKVVNAKFHEKFNKENAGGKDFVRDLAARYMAPARYQKAYQAVEPEGPKDIPKMLAYCSKDIEEEEGDEIRDLLWKRYGKEIIRKAVGGLPKWYMDEYGNKLPMEGQG